LDFSFSNDGLAFISESQASQLSNVEVKEKDVLLNITGDSVARVCQVPSKILPARVNQHVAIIRPDQKKLSAEFLKYYLLNPKFKYFMLGMASVGGTRNALTKGMIEDFEIETPDLPTQTRIADILSVLDYKIELNRQSNATLEAIAQAIFKEWFVDFRFPGATGEMQDSELGSIPKGWRVGKLGDLCDNVRKTVQPRDVVKDTPYVGLEHIPRKSLGLISWGVSGDVNSQKTHFNKYDVLFGKLRPYFHKVCIAPLAGISSTDILVIKHKNKDAFSFCLNHLYSNKLIAFVSAVADGTRMPRVDWKTISHYEIVIPSEQLLSQFNEVTFPYYKKIIENNHQSTIIAQIRDVLLPKLMNGEIPVGADNFSPLPTEIKPLPVTESPQGNHDR